MKKIILDLNIPNTKEELHAYLKETMELPDYYGNNLDALYDCVSEICEPTAFGIITPRFEIDEKEDELASYISKVCGVFTDAEEENSDIAVFIM